MGWVQVASRCCAITKIPKYGMSVFNPLTCLAAIERSESAGCDFWRRRQSPILERLDFVHEVSLFAR
jgi:hypothetical protein